MCIECGSEYILPNKKVCPKIMICKDINEHTSTSNSGGGADIDITNSSTMASISISDDELFEDPPPKEAYAIRH